MCRSIKENVILVTPGKRFYQSSSRIILRAYGPYGCVQWYKPILLFTFCLELPFKNDYKKIYDVFIALCLLYPRLSLC